jgi:hypothetical protein
LASDGGGGSISDGLERRIGWGSLSGRPPGNRHRPSVGFTAVRKIDAGLGKLVRRRGVIGSGSVWVLERCDEIDADPGSIFSLAG